MNSGIQRDTESLTVVAGKNITTLGRAVDVATDIVVGVHRVWAGGKQCRGPPQTRAEHKGAHMEGNPTDSTNKRSRDE